jgi:hypothetical protein
MGGFLEAQRTERFRQYGLHEEGEIPIGQPWKI